MAVAHEKDVDEAGAGSSPRRAWWRWFHHKQTEVGSQNPEARSQKLEERNEVRVTSGRGTKKGWDVDRGPKVGGELADVLIMGTIESKAPAESPGTGDLLDALVRDHLERAAAPGASEKGAAVEEGGGVMEEFYRPSASEAATEVAAKDMEGPSAEERAANLQREIEMLLAGEPAEETAPRSHEGHEDPRSGGEGEEKEGELAGDLSLAELEVLLKGGEENGGNEKPEARSQKSEEGGMSAELAAAVEEAVPRRHEEHEDAQSGERGEEGELPADQVEEAEGVLAEELAQLMAETQAAEVPSASAGTADWTEAGKELVAAMPEEEISEVLPEVKKDEAELAAAVRSIMGGKAGGRKPEAGSMEGGKSEIGNLKSENSGERAGTAEAVAAVEGEVAAAAEAVAAVKRAELPAPPPGAPEHPVIELELPPGIQRRPGLVKRAEGILWGIVMLVLQALDLPFGWIKEADKNVIGVAALCLLVGGFVLFGWVCWLARH